MAVDFLSRCGGDHIERLYLCCDCVKALEAVVNPARIEKRTQTVVNILSSIFQINEMGIRVSMVWIPGHSNVKYNEMADEAAKRVAGQVHMGKVQVESRMSLENCVSADKGYRQSAVATEMEWVDNGRSR